MCKFLKKNHFEVTWLADRKEQGHKLMFPSKKNIMSQIQGLLKVSGEGDAIWVYFSGHGLPTGHKRSTEADGQDEGIMVLNEQTKKVEVINDDWLTKNFANKLQQGIEAFVMFDACHSGTAIDLPYVYKPGSGFRKNPGKENAVPHREDGKVGRMVFLAACRDHQESAGLIGKAANGKSLFGSLLTLRFANIMEDRENRDIRLDDMMDDIVESIAGAGYEQKPLLSANWRVAEDELFRDLFDGGFDYM